jgi:hypothetical protein
MTKKTLNKNYGHAFKIMPGKVFLSLLAMSAVLGCAPGEALKASGANVQITSNTPKADCRFMQQISVSSRASPGWGQNPTEDIYNRLRNRASELGGNLVRIETMGLNAMAGGAAIGSVYSCK